MPATRSKMQRDAKAAEILDAAEPLLLRDGYEATTMAAIATAAGVAPNAVYWYFAGKDEVLAAVMRRLQERGFARLDALGPISLRERALAVLAEIDELGRLSTAVHERARLSPAVAAIHEEFHVEIERRAREAFEQGGLDPEEAGLAAGSLIAIVEGIHLHDQDHDAAARDELVLWAIGRFLAGSA